MDIILISGKQCSGKSSVAAELTKSINNSSTIKIISILYTLHNGIKELLIRNDYKFDEEKDGDLLQVLGDWFRKKYGQDSLPKSCLKQLLTPNKTIIVDDLRMRNEFDILTKETNSVTVRLNCPEEIRKQRSVNSSWREDTNHITETDLDSYDKEGKFDLYFNTDTTSIEEVARSILVHLENKKRK